MSSALQFGWVFWTIFIRLYEEKRQTKYNSKQSYPLTYIPIQRRNLLQIEGDEYYTENKHRKWVKTDKDHYTITLNAQNGWHTGCLVYTLAVPLSVYSFVSTSVRTFVCFYVCPYIRLFLRLSVHSFISTSYRTFVCFYVCPLYGP